MTATAPVAGRAGVAAWRRTTGASWRPSSSARSSSSASATARDFGPRLFAWIAGWGKVAMPGDYGNINTYFWIPIIGPFLGGVIGAIAYDFGIRDTLLARGETAPPEIETRGRTVEEEG